MFKQRLIGACLLMIFFLGLSAVYTSAAPRNQLKKPQIAQHQNSAGLVKKEKYNVGINDRLLLAKAVYGEARGEPFDGQIAVAAVIMNRLQSKDFPNSIPDIIYQSGAFTAVADGQINLKPDTRAFQAVDAALNGEDPSEGALYYYNPAKTTSEWIWSRSVITQIGYHVFAR